VFRFKEIVKSLMVFAIVMTSSVTFAQQSPRSSLLSQHKSSYNPAYCGSESYGDINMVVREQYLKFPDNSGPSSVWFNAVMPLKKINSGAGLSLMKVDEGFESRIDFKVNYAYQVDLNTGKLGLGLSVGGNTIGWSIENPIYPDGPSDNFIDEKILSQETFLNLLLGFGVYYKLNDLYASFAVTEMNEPNLKYETGDSDYFKRHYWVNAGYEYKTSNPMWTLYPSMLLKTTVTDTQLNFDLTALYNNFIVGGVSYITGNDFSLVAGVKFSNGGKFDGMRALISYDLIGSQIRAQSSGSVEFMVGYSFNLSVEKVNKTYKSVRFL